MVEHNTLMIIIIKTCLASRVYVNQNLLYKKRPLSTSGLLEFVDEEVECTICFLFMVSNHFCRENEDAVQPVASMPNVSRYGINQLIPVLSELVDKGLKSILIFGVISNLPKVITALYIFDVYHSLETYLLSH